MKKTVEIACSNYQSCIHAWQGGADRIELIENLADGGCTPSFGMIKMVKENIPLPIYVMIRPRGGDFDYSEEEFEIMKSDIEMCKQLKADGIVFGILDDQNEIDIAGCAELLKIWGGKATFHRAIDCTSDIEHSTQQIVDLGFERILTSGGKSTALEGLEAINSLQNQFGSQINIMPGCGINDENVFEFRQYSEVHATCKFTINQNNSFGTYTYSDLELIKRLIANYKIN